MLKKITALITVFTTILSVTSVSYGINYATNSAEILNNTFYNTDSIIKYSNKNYEPIEFAKTIRAKQNKYISNLDISESDTTVENKDIKKLHITKKVKEGEITLKNVIVKDTLYYDGEDNISLVIEDSLINNLEIINSSNVKISVTGNTSINNAYVKTGNILDYRNLSGHGFEKITVDSDSCILLQNDYNVYWNSSYDTIASINEKGLITANKKGTAQLTAYDKNGNDILNLSLSVNNESKDKEISKSSKHILEKPLKGNYTSKDWIKYESSVAFDSENKENNHDDYESKESDDSNNSNKDEVSKTIKILSIGNSFSEDSLSYIYDIAKSAGINVIIGNLYISGCSLENHWDYAFHDYPYYTYEKWTSSDVTKSPSQTMKSVLLDEDWDFVTLQQVSGSSGVYTSFQPYLNNLIAFVKRTVKNDNTKFALNMTWAYSADSTHECYKNYDADQISMYDSIIDSYIQAITDANVDIVIPCGTALQNGRTSPFLNSVGDQLTRDGFHLDMGMGRYIAALTFFQTLIVNNSDIEKDIFKDVSFLPDTEDSNDYLAYLAKIAVINAVNDPFKITDI